MARKSLRFRAGSSDKFWTIQLSGQEHVNRMTDAVRSLFVGVARKRQLVVIADDADRLSSHTRTALARLATASQK